MNEEELKKGCGNTFEREDKYYLNKIVIGKCGSQIGLCPTCQARLEGFQKGELKERERIRDFIIEVKNSYEIKSRYGEKAVINICAYLEEQLQKGINSQTEQNSDKEVAQPYSKSDKTTKEIGEEKC